jgi:mRNA interferase MazF
LVSDYAPKPGDIVWLDFDPTLGTEQAGRRPALVISDAEFNAVAGRALLAPITTRVRGWPFEVLLPQGGEVSGVALVDQIRMIDWRARKVSLASEAPEPVLQEARAKLAALAGIA